MACTGPGAMQWGQFRPSFSGPRNRGPPSRGIPRASGAPAVAVETRAWMAGKREDAGGRADTRPATATEAIVAEILDKESGGGGMLDMSGMM
jgi:hypothetical protein